MRADRLLSILMLLQARGRMTAGELAAELEVSLRTIYRDVDALCAAGVPLYGSAGAAGGYALVESYRTSLTGLTEGEVRALFMLGVPAPLLQLGLGRELGGALLKLAAALPDSRRGDERRARERFYLDAAWWHQGEESVPHLRAIYDAVWRDQRLSIRHRPVPVPAVEIEQIVDPLGLVAKAGVWYLVAEGNGQMRVHRVGDLLDARVVAEPCRRPPGFDLVAFWKTWCAVREEDYENYPVQVRIAPDLVPFLPLYFGDSIRERLAQAGPADAEGRLILELRFESLIAARERLLSFGRSVEVLSPLALRRSILDFAEQTVVLYRHTNG